MSKTMRENIEFLKRNRSAGTEAFLRKLEEVGLSVYYGKYSYWDQQPYVKVGEQRVYLVEKHYEGQNTCLYYRSQNSVIKEIKEVIEKEVEAAKKADSNVTGFFAAFTKREGES